VDKNGLSSFLLGLGVGVGIGMLFAPKSGQETRDIIKNKAGESSEYLKNKAGESSEFLKQKAGEGSEFLKHKAGDSTEYLKQRGTEVKQTAAEWVDKGRDALGRQKDTLNEAVEAGKQAYRDAVS